MDGREADSLVHIVFLYTSAQKKHSDFWHCFHAILSWIRDPLLPHTMMANIECLKTFRILRMKEEAQQ